MDYDVTAPPSAVNKTVALVDDKEYNFIFPIPKYPSITRTKIYSPYHKFGGFRWRLFLYPQGNATKSYLSVYLECGGPVKKNGDAVHGNGNKEWNVPVHFYIHLIHPARWMEVGVSTDDLRRYTKEKISTWLKQSEPMTPSAAAEIRRNSSAHPRKNGKNWLKKKDDTIDQQDSAAVIRRHSTSARKGGKKSKLITPRQDSSWMRQESTWLKQIKKQDDSFSNSNITSNHSNGNININSNSNGNGNSLASRWPPHKLKSLPNPEVNMEESPFHSSTKMVPQTRNNRYTNTNGHGNVNGNVPGSDTKSWLKQIENMDDISGGHSFPHRSHPNHQNMDIVDDTAHVFSEKERDWGFCEFAPFTLLQPSSHCDASYNFVIKVRIRMNENAVAAVPPPSLPKKNYKNKNSNITSKLPSVPSIPPPPPPPILGPRSLPIPAPPMVPSTRVKAIGTIGTIATIDNNNNDNSDKEKEGVDDTDTTKVNVNSGALVTTPVLSFDVKSLQALKAKQRDWTRATMEKISVKEMAAMLSAFLVNYEEDASEDFTKMRAKLEKLFRSKYINAAMFVEGKHKHIEWLSNLILDQVCEGDKDTRVSLEFSLERFFRLVQSAESNK